MAAKQVRMLNKIKIVLIMASSVLALVGLVAPAAVFGDGPQSASLSGLAGTLSGVLGDSKTPLPAAMTAIKTEIIYGTGAIFLSALVAALLAWFKFLRLSLAPSLLMTGVAGYLLFYIGASGVARIDVPGSWAWIPLIAGSLVALGTGVFALFGAGEDMEDLPTEPIARRPLPDIRPVAEPFPETQPAIGGKPMEAGTIFTADKVSGVKPRDKFGAKGPPPDGTIAAIGGKKASQSSTNGTIIRPAADFDEATDISRWILSGYDSNGKAVRLSINEMALRANSKGLIVGRSSKKAKLVLKDKSVSQMHARIALGDRLTMEDLDSSNGTRVNGRALATGEKVQIEQGAAIEIGSVRLTLTRP